MSPFPEFLVIGAMKSGTTSLYEDLRANSAIFIPDKESSGLVDFDVMTPLGKEAYGGLFRKAPASSVVGDVATTYTMQPHFNGVVERAKSLFDHVKLIYIVREPVSRIISHHHHDFSSGALTSNVDDAVRNDARLLDYTRYASQLRPWVNAFGAGSTKVLRFESYIDDRVGTMRDVFAFLSVDCNPSSSSFDRAHNVSEGKRVAIGGWRKIARSPLYRTRIRPLIPKGARDRISGRVLPEAPQRLKPPRPDTVELILDELTPEMEELAAMTGGQARWDLAEVRARFQNPRI